MNRQRFTRSLRINFSQISMFLFGHFFVFGPGAARTQYLAPDALHLSAFAVTITGTHTTHWRLLPPVPLRSAFALSLYRWPTHNTHWRSPPPVPLRSDLAVSLYRWTTHTVCLSKPQLCRVEAASQRLCGFQRWKGWPTFYTAPFSRLLVSNSPQVWRQCVQMDNHHLCPGVPLNPVYDVIDPVDVIGTLPVTL